MTLKPSCLAAAIVLLAHGLAHSAEPLVRYDTFKAPGINATRWVETDNARTATAGALRLSKTTQGAIGGDNGYAFELQPLTFANSNAVTAIAADVTIEAVAATACEANSVIGSSKLRIGGGFFNIATATPGSALNDVVAQVTVGRSSNSADAEGELRVNGAVALCLSADCGNQKVIGAPVDLGIATVGTTTRLSVQLDRTLKTFVFQRDDGAAVQVPYTNNDAAEAGLPAKTLSVRNLAPNCASGPRTLAKMLSKIDNVSVNKAAVN